MNKKKSKAATPDPLDKPATLKDLLSQDVIAKLKEQAEEMKEEHRKREAERRAQEDEARKAEQKKLENNFEYLLNNYKVDGKK